MKIFRTFLIAIIVGATLIVIFPIGSSAVNGDKPTSLMMYCAAGVKTPVVLAAKQFEKETGVQIELQYGGSGTLLSSLQVSGIGDLYLAADSSYTEIGVEKGVLTEEFPVAYLIPVIAVQKGNPKAIKSIQQLADPSLRVAFGSPEAASIGKQTKNILTKCGYWESVSANVTANGVFKPTVSDVANDIKLGAVDAGIIWDATVNQMSALEAVHVPELDTAKKTVTVAILRSSRAPQLAIHFARFLSSKRGNAIFKDHGFESIDGNTWSGNLTEGDYKNGVTEVPSSSRLVPSVATASVDATIAYITDTKADSVKVEVIIIDSPKAMAVRPISISTERDKKYLARPLKDSVLKAKGDFEKASFAYLVEGEK